LRLAPAPSRTSRPPAAPPDLYTLSLHDALPISTSCCGSQAKAAEEEKKSSCCGGAHPSSPGSEIDPVCGMSVDTSTDMPHTGSIDRKSTRLNSSHVSISYAVFCLKKKKQRRPPI